MKGSKLTTLHPDHRERSPELKRGALYWRSLAVLGMTCITLSLLLVSLSVHAEARYIFVSFSMPPQLLTETLKDSARLKITAVLNGLYHNSFAQTSLKLMQIAKDVPDTQLQIDPTAFERFEIHQVPALVVDHDACFDVIYGHLSLDEGLSRIAQKGRCASRGLS